MGDECEVKQVILSEMGENRGCGLFALLLVEMTRQTMSMSCGWYDAAAVSFRDIGCQCGRKVVTSTSEG